MLFQQPENNTGRFTKATRKNP